MKLQKMILSITLVLTMAITGCGSEEQTQSESATTETASAKPSESAETTEEKTTTEVTEPITFVDDLGNEITMEKPAESFVLFCRETPALLSINEGTEKFMGIQPEDQKVMSERVYGKYYPELLSLNTSFVVDGKLPNVEELLKLSPEVIFQWSSRGEAGIAPMTSAGLNVVTVGWGDWEDDIERLKLYAAPLGETERVDAMLERQDIHMKEIQAITSTIPAEKRQDHVFVDAINGNEIVAWGEVLPFTPIHGVDNAAYTKGNVTESDATINIETLLTWDPDMIILNSYRCNVTPADVYADPLLQELSAVKNKKVYMSMDTSLVDNPMSSWYWYATLAYPELFGDYDMRTRLKEDYKYLYNIDLTDEDIDQILNVEENVNNLNYDKFLAK